MEEMLNCFKGPIVNNVWRASNSIVRKKALKVSPTAAPRTCYSSLRTNTPQPPRYRLRHRRAQQPDHGNSIDNVTGQYNLYNVPNPNGVLTASDPVVDILSRPALVMERQIEMMNVFLGFEQANRYAIMDPSGEHLGYMEEEDFGITKAILRQVYRLHRPFSVRVLDRHGYHILTIRRPFSFINSHIKAILPSTDSLDENSLVVGETKQQWHLWRRRYNLFLKSNEEEFDQFGMVDAPFLSFEFPIQDEQGNVMGTVDRNWVGLGRELFTDTGVYLLRMDPSAFQGMENYYPNITGPLTLDQRAVMLGTAVSVDFDYFSRHSNRGGLFSFGDYE